LTSPLTFPFGPAQATDNVTSLAAGAAKVLGQVGVNQGVVWDYTVAPMQIKSGTGTTAGTVDILIAVSETSGAPPTGNWTDFIDPTLATDQSSKITDQMTLARTLNVSAASTLYKADGFGLYNILGRQPMFWTLVIRNNTNFALDTTAANFIFMYSQMNFSVPVPIVYA